MEDHQKGDSTAVIGLGAILVGTIALPVVAKLGRPVLKSIIKKGLSISSQPQLTASVKPVKINAYASSEQNGRH